jgi:hypothetical protein
MNPVYLLGKFYDLRNELSELSHPQVDLELLQQAREYLQKAAAKFEEACIEYINS